MGQGQSAAQAPAAAPGASPQEEHHPRGTHRGFTTRVEDGVSLTVTPELARAYQQHLAAHSAAEATREAEKDWQQQQKQQHQQQQRKQDHEEKKRHAEEEEEEDPQRWIASVEREAKRMRWAKFGAQQSHYRRTEAQLEAVAELLDDAVPFSKTSEPGAIRLDTQGTRRGAQALAVQTPEEAAATLRAQLKQRTW